MLRKTTLAAAVLAFATAGSALFGGSALAAEDDWDYNTAGSGGYGGTIYQDCKQEKKEGTYNTGMMGMLTGLTDGLTSAVTGSHDGDSEPTNKSEDQYCIANANGGHGGDADKEDEKDKSETTGRDGEALT